MSSRKHIEQFCQGCVTDSQCHHRVREGSWKWGRWGMIVQNQGRAWSGPGRSHSCLALPASRLCGDRILAMPAAFLCPLTSPFPPACDGQILVSGLGLWEPPTSHTLPVRFRVQMCLVGFWLPSPVFLTLLQIYPLHRLPVFLPDSYTKVHPPHTSECGIWKWGQCRYGWSGWSHPGTGWAPRRLLSLERGKLGHRHHTQIIP